jgi:hypothetical protein
MAKHATVKIGEWTVPLIGLPQSASQDKCDGCGKVTEIRDLSYDGTRFLCRGCVTNRKCTGA